jgi:hypothetical protein
MRKLLKRHVVKFFGTLGPLAWVVIDDFGNLLGRDWLIPLGGLLVGWGIDEIRATRITSVRMLDLVEKEADLQRMSNDVRDLSERISQIEVSEFDSAKTFFEALTRMFEDTKASVLLTQIRSQTPTQMGTGDAGKTFNRALAEWLNTPDTERTARRILSLPNLSRIEWAKEQVDPDSDLGRLRIKAVNGEEGIPNINFAVFDEKRVFVLLTADDANSYRGLGFSNRDVARNFAAYFELLWNAAKDLNIAIPQAERRLQTLATEVDLAQTSAN